MRLKPILSALTGVALLGGALATLAVSTNALAQQNARRGPSADERHAIQVVTEFVQAFIGDPSKAASLMADNFEWRGDPGQAQLQKGGDGALKMITNLSNPNGRFHLSSIDIGASTAYGGRDEILVIQRRVDHIVAAGKPVSVPLAGFFRVSPKTWKVEEWLDAPLTRPNLGRPPGGAPPGAAPGGGGPPPGGPPPGQ